VAWQTINVLYRILINIVFILILHIDNIIFSALPQPLVYPLRRYLRQRHLNLVPVDTIGFSGVPSDRKKNLSYINYY
jgi:hypothetical protein